MMTKYRAVLFTSVKLEREQQIFGNDYEKVMYWARHVVGLYPDAKVEIYRTSEDLIEIVYADSI